ncbi:hypothetical protein FE257_010369 [Aspergillus nanangensis]|uniref:O-methyltransferase n=1 Tax=Aspergillus nanangensis TaxID=2582783 RepID=A0AAD4CIM0_ASPNN|nr:hypothetical protein FE257_010369 [Aspergillus nanangensis]
MKDTCILPLNKSQAARAGDYCTQHSAVLPSSVAEQARLTEKLFPDLADMAPSNPQCSWMMSFTRVLRPSRILELGTFTGVSALAFYEATRDTQAEITTIEMSEKFLQISGAAFAHHGADDRIQTVQGECLKMLPTLKGEFDLIYIDAANDEYEAYTRYILDHKLLSSRGVLLVDDTLHEGAVFDASLFDQLKEQYRDYPQYPGWTGPIHKFNEYAVSDDRVVSTLLPIFNGVTQITWK